MTNFKVDGAKIWSNCFVSAANLWIIIDEVSLWAVGQNDVTGESWLPGPVRRGGLELHVATTGSGGVS
jgi:hypothetical protein